MFQISQEMGSDIGAREALLDRAMGPARHIKTSARLRSGRKPAEGLALVARDATGWLVGTVRLWHVALGEEGRSCLMLGPLAVDPAAQGTGIGQKLMHWALAEAAFRGHEAVILVGDPEYYGRFGFSETPAVDLVLPGPVERRRFLGLELRSGALAGASGMVRATGELVPEIVPAVAMAS
jgi:predicted N-acetyltransferase YhbS